MTESKCERKIFEMMEAKQAADTHLIRLTEKEIAEELKRRKAPNEIGGVSSSEERARQGRELARAQEARKEELKAKPVPKDEEIERPSGEANGADLLDFFERSLEEEKERKKEKKGKVGGEKLGPHVDAAFNARKENPEAEPKAEEEEVWEEEGYAEAQPEPDTGGANAPTLSRSKPLVSAKAFAKARLYREGILATHYHAGNWWQWNGKFYEVASDHGMETRVSDFLDGATTWAKEGLARFNPKTADINEVLAATRRHCLFEEAPPKWFGAGEGAEPWLVFRNCLVNYESGEVRALTPRLWAHGGLDFDYDPEARCPRWNQFLCETFPKDPEASNCVEEQMGYGMTWDTSIENIGLWIGKRRSGKSTAAWVQEQLVGPTLFVSLNFEDWMRGENSRANLVGKKLGLFPDVRLKPAKAYGNVGYDPGGLDYKSVQLLVQISGRDRVGVPGKYEKLPWQGRLGVKFQIVSNDPLKFHDPGGALAERLVKVAFGQTRPKEARDRELRAKLRPELPGIAARCLRAYQRLRARGWFIQPASAAELEREIEEAANPYLKFMRDTFVIDPDGKVGGDGVRVSDLFWMKFDLWRKENKRMDLQVSNGPQVIKEVKKIEPYDKILAKEHRLDSEPRWYAGIKLRPEGKSRTA